MAFCRIQPRSIATPQVLVEPCPQQPFNHDALRRVDIFQVSRWTGYWRFRDSDPQDSHNSGWPERENRVGIILSAGKAHGDSTTGELLTHLFNCSIANQELKQCCDPDLGRILWRLRKK